MARQSRSDVVIIEHVEDLIRRIQRRAGTDQSIKQVLENDPYLAGEAMFASRLILEMDHIKINDVLLIEFVDRFSGIG